MNNNGWEFLTDVTPNVKVTSQNLQNNYIENYNLAYNNFINNLKLTEDELNNIKSTEQKTKYKIIIDVSGDNDIIKITDYPINFLKSKFLTFKTKRIKTDLINYYKPLGFFVKGPFELLNNNSIQKYYFEIYWN